jgi:glutamate dehydrogenase/leucine dehydrogenase
MSRTQRPERSSLLAPSPQQLDHEEVRVVRGRRTGITIAVGIHSTTAGPATGGCRIRTYGDWREGLQDALRLSAAMTTKCVLGGLPHGGGKTVAMPIEPLDPARRADLIRDIGELIASFAGRYITGPDIGTSPADMEVLHAATGGAAYCRPEASGGSGDSSTATARGVLAALKTAVDHTYRQQTTEGLRVGVIGFGHVGSLIASALTAEGARVRVYDVDHDLRPAVDAAGMTWWTTPSVAEDLDVLVPAATGGLLTPESSATCGARLVVGPANNQITDDSVDEVLHRRGVTWIPDVLASGGGAIYAVSREGLGLDEAASNARVDGIGATTAELFAQMDLDGSTTLQATRRIADQRILDRGPGGAT